MRGFISNKSSIIGVNLQRWGGSCESPGVSVDPPMLTSALKKQKNCKNYDIKTFKKLNILIYHVFNFCFIIKCSKGIFTIS